MHICKICDNDLTKIRFDIRLQNFKKPLDIFLTANRKKTFHWVWNAIKCLLEVYEYGAHN